MSKKIEDLIKVRLSFINNSDLFYRNIKIDNYYLGVFFFSSLVDENQINHIMHIISLKNGKFKVLDCIIKVESSKDIDYIISQILEGQVAIIFKEFNYLVDLKKYPYRGIVEPDVEKTIRGSRDGFTESIITNIALIRTRIKSEHLINQIVEVGDYSKTKIGIMYLDDQVDYRKLYELKTKILSIETGSLIMSDRALEEKIFPQGKTLFPLVRYSERPDIASIQIMQGKIIIIVDTSPSVIITPITIFDHLKHVEEFRQTPLVGTFTKIIRLFASFLSLFLIPTMYLLQTNNYQINIQSFYLENSAYFPLVVQYLMATLIVELFRIAIVHTPNALLSALSIVIGIIFSEVSLKVGLFDEEVLLIVAFSAICNFSIPSYELSMGYKIIMIISLVVASVFGIAGYMLFLSILFIRLVSINVMGESYLSPFIPFDIKKFKEKVIRNDASKKDKA